MRARIFRRFLWSAFLLLAASLVALNLYVARVVWRAHVSSVEGRLAAEARLLAAGAPDNAALDAWVHRAAQTTGDRVSVIGRDGAVLADSAPGNGFNKSLFASVPLSSVKPGATLRLSESPDVAGAAIPELQMWLLAASLAITGAAAGIAYLFMRSFSRRAGRLREYVEGLLDARLPDSELPASDDELGALAQSLRRTAPQIRDVVERLKVEGARREAILASMVEGVLAVDRDMRVTFCNASFARTVGTRMPVPPGLPLLDLVRDPGLLEIMTTVLNSGDRVERRLILPGAEFRFFEVLAGPLGGPPNRGALAILHDITKLEKLERVRKDFVANVSHELRTPLAAIRGYAETLLDGALEDAENNYRFVEIILAHSIRLNNIASDLLTLSELESSGAAVPPKCVSIRAALESALRTVDSGARVRGVKLASGEIQDLKVIGQELRLEQAFVNLLDNAVKFNRPNGDVTIETYEADGYAKIAIADTGLGIPSEDLPRIFERFYRVDKARSRAVGGTGLGLSIVRHIIEQMGGAITVDSQLGKGSRFLVTLPLWQAEVKAPL